MNSYQDMFEMDSIEVKVVRIFMLAFAILIVYQTLQFINIRRIDKKHTELLVARHQSIGAVQNLLIQNSTIQRKLLNMALTEDQNEINELKSIIASSAASNDISLGEIESALLKINPDLIIEFSELKNASEDYRVTYSSYINMLLTNKTGEALEFKNSNLRPSYEAYQALQQQTLVRITDDLIVQSNKLSSYTTISSWVMFFVGLAPFIYAIAKLIYLSYFMKLKTWN